MATEEKSDISEIISALKRGKWIILICFLCGLFLAGLYILQEPNVYKADSLLQIAKITAGEATNHNVLLQENGRLFVETERNILLSKTILTAVVDSLKLYISIQPRTFPLLGRIFAKRAGTQKSPKTPPLKKSSYCWGSEELTVDFFSPPQQDFGKVYKLVSTGNGKYNLFHPDGRLLFQGTQSAPAPDFPDHFLGIKTLRAHPGAVFFLTRKTITAAIESLLDNLEVNEQGTNSGILRLTLFGRDPQVLKQSLNTLTGIYMQQKNSERLDHLDRTLSILRHRLPEVKADLNNAETAMRRFQQKFGTVSPDNMAKSLYDRIIEIEKQLSALELQQLEYEQKYTKGFKGLDLLKQKQNALYDERQSLEVKLEQLPEGRLVGLRLSRDLDIAEAMYLQLLSETEKLELALQDINREVRVVDPAVVYDTPVEPRKRVILALGAFIGFFGGFFFILTRNLLLDFRPVSPMSLEDRTGLPVFSSIPQLTKMKKLPPLSTPPFKKPLVKYFQHIYVQLGQSLDGPINTIAITSWNAGAGKSLVSHFLAQTFALMGHKVLVVDISASQRQLFRDQPGLVDLTTGACVFQQAVHRIDVYKEIYFDFLPRGLQDYPLIPFSDIQDKLDNWLQDYEYIILDTPAIFEHADILAVLKTVHVNLLVVREYQNTVENIQYCKRYAERAGVHLVGLVLNDIPQPRI